MNIKAFSDDDLTDAERSAIEQRVMDGCVTASLIVLARLGEKLGSLDADEMAGLALKLGDYGDLAEVAIANVNVWYRDEFPQQIDRVISDAKFSALTE